MFSKSFEQNIKYLREFSSHVMAFISITEKKEGGNSLIYDEKLGEIKMFW